MSFFKVTLKLEGGGNLHRNAQINIILWSFSLSCLVLVQTAVKAFCWHLPVVPIGEHTIVGKQGPAIHIYCLYYPNKSRSFTPTLPIDTWQVKLISWYFIRFPKNTSTQRKETKLVPDRLLHPLERGTNACSTCIYRQYARHKLSLVSIWCQQSLYEGCLSRDFYYLMANHVNPDLLVSVWMKENPYLNNADEKQGARSSHIRVQEFTNKRQQFHLSFSELQKQWQRNSVAIRTHWEKKVPIGRNLSSRSTPHIICYVASTWSQLTHYPHGYIQ